MFKNRKGVVMQATRAFIISDLHLGGAMPAMMSHSNELAAFINELPKHLRGDEALELVIAGDFVDFPAIALDDRQEAWTCSPERAVDKLKQTMREQDAPVFEALGGFVRNGHRLTVIVGNHDLEMAIPAVQQAFCDNLRISRHQIVFVDDGQAWRIGNALIEHGNRYDGANLNDWQGLRAAVSAWSRDEIPPASLDVSAGSQIVEQVVNSLKKRYPFIDILQPQGELLGYLLLEMEPALKHDFKKIRRLIVGAINCALARKEGPPRAERNVARLATNDDLVGKPLDTRNLDELLGVEPLSVSEQEVGAQNWIREFLLKPGDNLARYLESGNDIPKDRLNRLQKVIAEMVDDDDSLNPAGETEQYGRNAQRLCKGTGVEVVVMGHTHKPRYVGEPKKATYINTGSWVDYIGVPREALEQSEDGAAKLQRWLSDLYHDRGARGFKPHWADLRIEKDGKVSEASLCP
jgi:UDP-2,3-diacylglucosamine pyrophosphatase LpxH